ncbi:MAG TPA: MATE family efflux transporter [Methylomirabilota bacterium]|nr:MATE family efflux transporter [Methylomirabilota bacterium]
MSLLATGARPAPPAPPARSARTQRLLEGPILSTLLRLALPNVLNLVALTLIITFDGLFIGRLGAEALAGVSLVFPFLMLMQHMAAGGMGGGVASAVARALGAGRREQAEALIVHALVIAAVMALLFTLTAVGAGPALYHALGGRGDALAAAVAYSNAIFAGAVAVWLVNTLGSVVRGTGNMLLPAGVLVGCALLHVALSPLLIFGWAPFPRLGIAGAGAGLGVAFTVGTLVLLAYLRSARALVHLPLRRTRLQRTLFREILRVGVPASLNTVLTNVTVMLLTALVATFGTAAVAGYGMGARIEYVIIPLAFGFGTALVTMVGTNIGAGQVGRAERVAWTGGAVVVALTGLIGLSTAAFPHAWIGLFTGEPDVVAAGAAYARIVGPTYPLFGLGLALYFAFQGAGRLFWPLSATVLRVVLAVGGGWLAIHALGAGLAGVFVACAVAFTLYGLLIAAALRAGAWRRVPRGT